MRLRTYLIAIGLLSATAMARSQEIPGPSQVPDEMRDFARELPTYFSKLENVIVTETITQTVMNETNGTIQRRRVLVSDYQIAPLGENPSALWEFRFVRAVDGRRLPGVDRKIEDFFRLRHPSAEEERRSIVNLAVGQSLPGCYWHNITLALLAFGQGHNENFEWRRKEDQFLFRQVRGLGIPEDLFNPGSARHYPSGAITIAPGGHFPSRVELEYRTDVRRIRMRLEYSPPSGSELICLPRVYEVDSDRVTALGFNPETRIRFEYSNVRRFSVSTEEGASPPAR